MNVCGRPLPFWLESLSKRSLSPALNALIISCPSFFTFWNAWHHQSKTPNCLRSFRWVHLTYAPGSGQIVGILTRMAHTMNISEELQRSIRWLKRWEIDDGCRTFFERLSVEDQIAIRKLGGLKSKGAASAILVGRIRNHHGYVPEQTEASSRQRAAPTPLPTGDIGKGNTRCLLYTSPSPRD